MLFKDIICQSCVPSFFKFWSDPLWRVAFLFCSTSSVVSWSCSWKLTSHVGKWHLVTNARAINRCTRTSKILFEWIRTKCWCVGSIKNVIEHLGLGLTCAIFWIYLIMQPRFCQELCQVKLSKLVFNATGIEVDQRLLRWKWRDTRGISHARFPILWVISRFVSFFFHLVLHRGAY